MQPIASNCISKFSLVSDLAAPLCGLVLAGGEGQRLRSFIMRLRGDSLPKQYVRFTGSRSMLEHTYRRAEKLVARERLFTVVNQGHLKHQAVVEQLAGRSAGTVVLQPENRETGPGLLLPLMHIYKRYANAIVAVFPSDQFIWEEEHLIRHVRLAQAIVKRVPSKFVLLGIKPDYEESEYGYIVPNYDRGANGWGIGAVADFVEKPDVRRARALTARGALWNTMMMVFKAQSLLQWVEELKPEMYHQFKRIYAAIGTPSEKGVVREIYSGLQTVNFSKELLEPMAQQHPDRLAVLPVSNVSWSDWGSESRIIRTLSRIGRAPQPFFDGRANTNPTTARLRPQTLRPLDMTLQPRPGRSPS